MSEEQTVTEGRKLRILLDMLHGEEQYIYDKLIKVLSERCQVTILKKKPVTLNTLTENDVFTLISPSKSWEESEIETVQRYVENEGGILVALTIDGRKPEHLNKLLLPFGISVMPGTVVEKYLDKDSLEVSPLLENVKSLDLGEVWGRRSIRISTSSEADIILQFKDVILGAQQSSGKGMAYLFTCLPVFGNKQLDQADNRRFLNNLIESLATPEMKDTLQIIAKEKALSSEEIIGAVQPDTSTMLFFTPNRAIVTKIGGASLLGKMAGLGLGGFIGLDIAEQIGKDRKSKKLRELSPDKILREDKANCTIPYDEIDKFTLFRGTKSAGFIGIRIKAVSKEHEFQFVLEGTEDKIDALVSLLKPLLKDRIFIED